MKLSDLKRLTDAEARAMLEKVRWPDGPHCPHCGNCDQARVGKVKANPAKGIREGLHQCKECRKQFTVTVGTIMEKTKLPLSHWLYAIAAMSNAKKGVSAKQLQRELKPETGPNLYGNYEAYWFMCHRVRHAMRDDGVKALLGGDGKTVVADETYVGGKPRYRHQGGTGRGTAKVPVFTLVERGGRARSFVTPNVNHKNLKEHLTENVDPKSTLVTDELLLYRPLGKMFAEHRTTLHGAREYARKEPDGTVTTSNEVEAFYSLLKRGVYGTFHHVSKEHLQRYCDEFDFRWNTRRMSDVDRALLIVKQSAGKRLMYRKPKASDIAPPM
ncbi:MAG: IS1595 family transposase [Flavobacteriales bacterium]|nr:IS1595 family transposase [Flavobacteriales bacterium]